MRHARKNDLGPKLADETEKATRTSAHPGRAEGVQFNARWKEQSIGLTLCDKADVQFVFIAGEVPCKQFGDSLCAAAAEMRNQQENPGTLRHDWMAVERKVPDSRTNWT